MSCTGDDLALERHLAEVTSIETVHRVIEMRRIGQGQLWRRQVLQELRVDFGPGRRLSDG